MNTTYRFIPCRWSATRKRIQALSVGEQVKFPPSQYYNAKQSVLRLNDAYHGNARWRIKYRKIGTRKPRTYVTRLT